MALIALLVAAAPAYAQEIGVKVLVGSWTDQPNPFSVEQVRDTIFQPVAGDAAGNGSETADGFIRALTGDGSWLQEAEAIEGVTSTFSSSDAPVTGCEVGSIIQDLQTQAGVDPALFDRVIQVVPQMPACPGSGWAQIPGKEVLLNGVLNWRLVAHELLHNDGAQHAGACVAMQSNGGCQANSYGDPFDIMGQSTGSLAGFPSAVHQYESGRLDFDRIQPVSADGVYEVSAANDLTPTSLPKALAINRGPGAWPFLTLETRIRRPYDDFLDPGARIYNGVTVHLADFISPFPPNGISTALVPANPSADPANARTWPLAVCEAYTDPASGATVRPLSVGGGVARVEIALGGRKLPERAECKGKGPGGGAVAEAALKAKKTQRVRGKAVKVKVVVSSGEQASVRVGGTIKAGKKSHKLKPKKASLAAGESKKLTLKPKGAKAKRAIAKALRGHGKAKAKLKAKFTDAAGNKTTKKAKVTLR